MSCFVLDTGIMIGLLRGAPYARYVLDEYQPFTAPSITVQSIVTLAELEAFGFRLKWGQKKMDALDELVRKIPQQDINHPAVIRQYVEIDAFRQSGHPERKLTSGQCAFSMGDNDIWIAATAAAMSATLLTTDKDFLPLNDEFIKVVYVDPKMSYSPSP